VSAVRAEGAADVLGDRVTLGMAVPPAGVEDADVPSEAPVPAADAAGDDPVLQAVASDRIAMAAARLAGWFMAGR
jgi:hypothetical protein